MKLRIVEDLEGCGKERWFRLEKLTLTAEESPDGLERWELIESGSNLANMTDKAERLKPIIERFVVIKEFNHELKRPESLTLVDEPPAIQPVPEPLSENRPGYCISLPPSYPDDDIPF